MELWSSLDDSLQPQTRNFFHIEPYLISSVVPVEKQKTMSLPHAILN